MSLCVLAQVCAHILVRVSVPVATKLTSEPQGFPLSPLLLKYWGYRYMLPYPAFLMWVLGVTSGLHASGTSTFQIESLPGYQDAVCSWLSASGFQPLTAFWPASQGLILVHMVERPQSQPKEFLCILI